MTEPYWARSARRASDLPPAGIDALMGAWNREERALPKTAAEAAAKAREDYLNAATLYTATRNARGRRRREAYETATLLMSSAQWLLLEEARLRAAERSTSLRPGTM